jgi:FGGY-family pentulose kinase
MLGRAEHPIALRRPEPDHAEHMSADIWAAVGAALRAARAEAAARPEAVAGLAFDATCSLVLRDREHRPLTAAADGDERWDTVVWHDHRARAEAEACTATGHRVLDHLGGAMSPEMQIPKLMWVARHRPAVWARLGLAFDLADFLAWMATGNAARSQCTLSCKWAYLGHEADGWPADFHAALGIGDLRARAGLPERATPVGADLGPLTPEAAAALGLTPATRVAAGLVDAYAGAVGVLGAFAEDPATLERQLALIAGTSTCLMAFSEEAAAMPGVWGPHLSVALPDLWMIEGGQSASGGLLEHLVRVWGGGGLGDGLGPELGPEAHARITARIEALRAEEGPDLAPRLHVLPDFQGNRSPLGDPRALGVISGLALDDSFDGLCRLYWRAAVAIALGLRHILEHMEASGRRVEALHITGGHARSPLLSGLYADATGRTVTLPSTPDAVLLGTAMVAAAGAGLHPSLRAAARRMHRGSTPRAPDPAARGRFDRDYAVFLEMHRQRRTLDAMLGAAGG